MCVNSYLKYLVELHSAGDVVPICLHSLHRLLNGVDATAVFLLLVRLFSFRRSHRHRHRLE